ncbi:MAG TPA: hypothetical protein VK306_07100 [Acidimicrobiales bacterium]|nr:hypothetical protein [Acidimicrobiales bacterium]
MSSLVARKMWRTLEPYHGLIYFTPRATEAYGRLGVARQAGYFASRAAAMGAVSPEVVIATFYNFDPRLVRAALPAAWDAASPGELVAARYGAADRALREVLGDDALVSAEMAEAADLARRAAEACPPEGRPLFAAHAGLAWPEDTHLVLWHAITLLREFRGDGHVAALLLEGIGACEALVTHGASDGDAVPLATLKSTRGWSDADWDAARSRLRERGWLDGDDALTAAGAAARARVEDLTDALAIAPWRALGDEGCDRLRSLVRPWSKTIVTSGVFLATPEGPA